jgi:hypothetical protein
MRGLWHFCYGHLLKCKLTLYSRVWLLWLLLLLQVLTRRPPQPFALPKEDLQAAVDAALSAGTYELEPQELRARKEAAAAAAAAAARAAQAAAGDGGAAGQESGVAVAGAGPGGGRGRGRGGAGEHGGQQEAWEDDSEDEGMLEG